MTGKINKMPGGVGREKRGGGKEEKNEEEERGGEGGGSWTSEKLRVRHDIRFRLSSSNAH